MRKNSRKDVSEFIVLVINTFPDQFTEDIIRQDKFAKIKISFIFAGLCLYQIQTTLTKTEVIFLPDVVGVAGIEFV